MTTRHNLVTTMTAGELRAAMAQTSTHIRQCRASADLGLLDLHKRWMDALLDELSRRTAAARLCQAS